MDAGREQGDVFRGERRDSEGYGEQRTASSSSSRGSSIGSIRSPSLQPSNVDAMNSSIISNLDLEGGSTNGQDAVSQEQFPSLTAIPEHAGLSHAGHPASAIRSQTQSNSSRGNQGIPKSFSSSNSINDADTSTVTATHGTGADDSALNALMEAHSSPSAAAQDTPQRPSRRDASFGLDPDADTHAAVHGQPLVPQLIYSPSGKHAHHRVIPPSHTSASTGAPATTENESGAATVPTVSATGMPRIWPRHASRSPSPSGDHQGRRDEKRGARRRRRRTSSVSSTSTSQASAPQEMQPQYAPSGSLTIALFSSGITWRRRSYLLLASIAINLGLPFLNGVMLGFGEIFARSIVAPWIGLAPAAVNINAPGARNEARTRASVANVGLRSAGRVSKDPLGDEEKRAGR